MPLERDPESAFEDYPLTRSIHEVQGLERNLDHWKR